MTTGEVRLLREYEEFNADALGLDERDWTDIEAFARKNQHDKRGNYRPVLAFGGRKRTLKATNFVGVLSTKRGTSIEILPKIDLAHGAARGGTTAPDASDADDQGPNAPPTADAAWQARRGGRRIEPGAARARWPGDRRPDDDREHETRRIFLQMLRSWRGLRHAELPPSAIRSLRRFPMLEAFAHLFLQNLAHLARHGLARRYVRVEDNLPYLRGRLLFQQHVRENLTNRARFYIAHDAFNPNRPANRLIRGSLDRLERIVRNEENRRLLRELTDAFANVPPTRDPEGDWRRHSVDRTMQHYRPVMAWVRLFLFGQGLATFHGRHENQSLLFPMEEIYEDFVTRCFSRYQDEYRVRAQGPRKRLTRCPGAFEMKPDITLLRRGSAKFILDAKWKRLKSASDDPTQRGIVQADLYQLYAYGKGYDCRAVALVYPRTDDFDEPLPFVFHDDLTLICLPFDVSQAKSSVHRGLAALKSPERAAEAWREVVVDEAA